MANDYKTDSKIMDVTLDTASDVSNEVVSDMKCENISDSSNLESNTTQDKVVSEVSGNITNMGNLESNIMKESQLNDKNGGNTENNENLKLKIVNEEITVKDMSCVIYSKSSDNNTKHVNISEDINSIKVAADMNLEDNLVSTVINVENHHSETILCEKTAIKEIDDEISITTTESTSNIVCNDQSDTENLPSTTFDDGQTSNIKDIEANQNTAAVKKSTENEKMDLELRTAKGCTRDQTCCDSYGKDNQDSTVSCNVIENKMEPCDDQIQNYKSNASNETAIMNDNNVPVQSVDSVVTNDNNVPLKSTDTVVVDENNISVDNSEVAITNDNSVPVENADSVVTHDNNVPLKSTDIVVVNENNVSVDNTETAVINDNSAPVENANSIVTNDNNVPLKSTDTIVVDENNVSVDKTEKNTLNDNNVSMENTDIVAINNNCVPVENVDTVAVKEDVSVNDKNIPVESSETVATNDNSTTAENINITVINNNGVPVENVDTTAIKDNHVSVENTVANIINDKSTALENTDSKSDSMCETHAHQNKNIEENNNVIQQINNNEAGNEKITATNNSSHTDNSIQCENSEDTKEIQTMRTNTLTDSLQTNENDSQPDKKEISATNHDTNLPINDNTTKSSDSTKRNQLNTSKDDFSQYRQYITSRQRKLYLRDSRRFPSIPGDDCDIFCANLPFDCSEYELLKLFKSIGQVWEVRLIMIPGNNKQSSGYAFVRFAELEMVEKAIKQFNRYEMRPGRKIKVSESEANVSLFVGNLHRGKSKEQIQERFKRITKGLVKVTIKTSKYQNTRNSGYCFLSYNSHYSAYVAKQKLERNPFVLWERQIFVDWSQRKSMPYISRESKTLFLSNLEHSISRDDLKAKFQNYGEITDVKLISNYAFIDFNERNDAFRALREFDAKQLGVNSEIEWALPKPRKTLKRPNIPDVKQKLSPKQMKRVKSSSRRMKSPRKEQPVQQQSN